MGLKLSIIAVGFPDIIPGTPLLNNSLHKTITDLDLSALSLLFYATSRVRGARLDRCGDSKAISLTRTIATLSRGWMTAKWIF